jgi:ATP-dependent Clp protease adapter protein ClpS
MKVLLFNDEKNTKEFVIQTLVKFIPGMTAEKVLFLCYQCELVFYNMRTKICFLFFCSQAKQVTLEAHQTGVASCEVKHFKRFSDAWLWDKFLMRCYFTTGTGIVGIWMLELAEAYSDVLRSQGLRSDIAEE